MADIITNTLQIGSNNLILRDADAQAQLVTVKDGLGQLDLYGEKTTANSKWPRITLSLTSGKAYLIRILKVTGESGYDQIWVNQGSASLTNDIKNGSAALFVPSGSDPIYLTVRYPSGEPSDTPTVLYYLTDVTASKNVITASMVNISSSNKTAICSGSLSNLQINKIYGVEKTASLSDAPFSTYFVVVTYGKYYSRTSGDVQLAVESSTGRTAIRTYTGSVWTRWSYGAVDVANAIMQSSNLHYVQASANDRWPRITLPTSGANNYRIKVLDIITETAIDACFVAQGDSQVATSLDNHATKVFTSSSDDPSYLTVRYSRAPSVTPFVLYSLEQVGDAYSEVTATNIGVNSTNKNAVCSGDINNLPLNSIIGVERNASLAHSPFLDTFFEAVTLGKYFSRTSGDLQFAVRTDFGTIAHRIYANGAWGAWNFLQNTSRFPGMKFSFIGDSISTFDQDDYKISGYRMAYPYLNVKSVDLTWWMKVLSASGAKLEVNASWSGSCASNVHAGSGYPDFYDRVSLLGSPDTIFVELGTNDSLQHVSLGEYDYETTYTSLSESYFRTAYIKGIKGLQANYPTATIVCLILSMDDDYANSIKSIAQTLGCAIVECRDYTIGDNTVHPGIVGMRQIASKVLYPETAVI